MKDKSIFRRIDDTNRIMISKDICTELNIKVCDQIEIYIENGIICLKPYNVEGVHIDSIDRLLSDESGITILEEIHIKLGEVIKRMKEAE